MHDCFLGSWETTPWKLRAHTLLAWSLCPQGRSLRGKEPGGGGGLSSAGWPLHLSHPLRLHGEGIDPRGHCILPLCHVRYQLLLSATTAALRIMLRLGSLSPQVPWCGRSCRALEVQQPQGEPFLAALPRPPFPHIFYLEVKQPQEWWLSAEVLNVASMSAVSPLAVL